VAVDDAAFRQIVGRQLDVDAVAGKNSDAVPAQPAGDVRENDVAVIELHRKRCAGKNLLDAADDLESGFLEILRRLGFFGRAWALSRASIARGY
jgi:hypothetical protein